MANLHDTIATLCEEKGVSGYRLCKDTGIQPSILTDLKKGRQKSLSAVNAEKIASYFGVSVSDLLGADNRSTITAENSVVMQGNRGNNTVAYGKPAEDGLSDMEKELLRIFRSLDMRHKNSFMSYAYSVEDEMKGMNSKE